MPSKLLFAPQLCIGFTIACRRCRRRALGVLQRASSKPPQETYVMPMLYYGSISRSWSFYAQHNSSTRIYSYCYYLVRVVLHQYQSLASCPGRLLRCAIDHILGSMHNRQWSGLNVETVLTDGRDLPVLYGDRNVHENPDLLITFRKVKNHARSLERRRSWYIVQPLNTSDLLDSLPYVKKHARFPQRGGFKPCATGHCLRLF